MALYNAGYLGLYCWPAWLAEEPSKSVELLLSIARLVLVRAVVGDSTWGFAEQTPAQLTQFIAHVAHGRWLQDAGMSPAEGAVLVRVLELAFQSLDNSVIRAAALRLVSMPLWRSVPDEAVHLTLLQYPALAQPWASVGKRGPVMVSPQSWRWEESDAAPRSAARPLPNVPSNKVLDAEAIPGLLADWLETLGSAPVEAPPTSARSYAGQVQAWAEAVAQLLCTCLAQLSTARFLRLLLHTANALPRARASAMCCWNASSLLVQRLDMLHWWLHFEVDEHTGAALDDAAIEQQAWDKAAKLQRLANTYLADESSGLPADVRAAVREWALGPAAPLTRPASLHHALGLLPTGTLLQIAQSMALVPRDCRVQDRAADVLAEGTRAPPTGKGMTLPDEEFGLDASLLRPQALTRRALMTMLLQAHRCKASSVQAVKAVPLYPDERLLWDGALVPFGRAEQPGAVAAGQGVALPPMSLQFLSMRDYLMRGFNLLRLEAAYAIRGEIVSAVQKLAPAARGRQDVKFNGWSKQAAPIDEFAVTHVAPQAVGEHAPAAVRAQVSFTTRAMRGRAAAEWDSLRQHDVVLLVTVAPPSGASKFDSLAGQKRGRDGGSGVRPDEDPSWASERGVLLVRGAEILQVTDADGNIYNDAGEEARRAEAGEPPAPQGQGRKFLLALDPQQYAIDAAAIAHRSTGTRMEDGLDRLVGIGHAQTSGASAAAKRALLSKCDDVHGLYTSFNVMLRRDGRSNNFKAVLDTIRRSLCEPSASLQASLPPWLHSMILGRGKPDAGHYSCVPQGCVNVVHDGQVDSAMDWGDTFVNGEHARAILSQWYTSLRFELESHPLPAPDEEPRWGSRLSIEGSVVDPTALDGIIPPPSEPIIMPVPDETVPGLMPPFKVFPQPDGSAVVRSCANRALLLGVALPILTSATGSGGGLGNRLPFTLDQCEAIKSGVLHGASLVVGPPGTGKTDVAVQTIATLYRNHPEQRILLVTHSNAALNDLFAKLALRSIPHAHLLRLGQGGRELADTMSGDADFSQWGRVVAAKARRDVLLHAISAASKVLPGSEKHGDIGYTVATATAWFRTAAVAAMEQFELSMLEVWREKPEECTSLQVQEAFPFSRWYTQLGVSIPWHPHFAASLELARQCWRNLCALVDELAAYRPLEVLRNDRLCTAFALARQARVVAMTVTHAAIARERLQRLGFSFDTVVMEEAGQVTDIESVLPMLLQRADEHGQPRLKRVLLLGDHRQLPPVITCAALATHTNLHQSLFERWLRLGVPATTLAAQGRARPELAAAYAWRYPVGDAVLGNLPRVLDGPYRLANGGVRHVSQFIDVKPALAAGESAPVSHFWQNLDEAEFMVSMYQYLRLIGWPAASVALLSPYAGQTALLRDIVAHRCADKPLYGQPLAVTTVDKYQGQQADIVLLSLTRTTRVGHTADVRRMTVALSRARLGLYIFGSAKLFLGVPELAPVWAAMQAISGAPGPLEIVMGELAPGCTRAAGEAPKSEAAQVPDAKAMGMIVANMEAAATEALAAQAGTSAT